MLGAGLKRKASGTLAVSTKTLTQLGPKRMPLTKSSESEDKSLPSPTTSSVPSQSIRLQFGCPLLLTLYMKKIDVRLKIKP